MSNIKKRNNTYTFTTTSCDWGQAEEKAMQSTFKKGDLVEVIDPAGDQKAKMDDKCRVLSCDEGNWGMAYVKRLRDGAEYGMYHSRFKLIERGKKMARRTFRLTKDTPDYKKGLLVQEECDDGDQRYMSINHDQYIKFDDNEIYFDDNKTSFSRKAVQNNPNYFEEVYEATSNYLSKAEMDKWKAFKGDKRRTKASKSSLKSISKTEAARRAKLSASAKAMWARRRARGQ